MVTFTKEDIKKLISMKIKLCFLVLLYINNSVLCSISQKTIQDFLNAATNNNVTKVDEFLKKHPDLVNKQNSLGETALMFASEKKTSIDLLKLLLKQPSIDVNIQRHDDKVFALYLACFFGNELAVQALLEHNDININLVESKKHFPLMVAVGKQHINIVRDLLYHKNNAGQFDIAIDQMNKSDQNVLLYAVGKQDEAILELLLKYIEEHKSPSVLVSMINNQDKFSETSLMRSVIINAQKILKMLLKFEANPNLQNKKGFTALMLAVLQDSVNYEIIQYLLEHNADPNVESNEGVTALEIAFNNNDTKSIDLLLQYGAKINQSLQVKIDKIYQQKKENLALLEEQLRDLLLSDEQSDRDVIYKQEPSYQQSQEYQELLQKEEQEFDRLFQSYSLELERLRKAQEFIQKQRRQFIDKESDVIRKTIEKEEDEDVSRIQKDLEKLLKQEEQRKKAIEAERQRQQKQQEQQQEKLLLYKNDTIENYKNKFSKNNGFSKREVQYLQELFQAILHAERTSISQAAPIKLTTFSAFQNVFINWKHIVDIDFEIKRIKEDVYTFEFAGGHTKEAVNKLLSTGLVKKIGEENWTRGGTKYTLQNILTNQIFIKTVFPSTWKAINIYNALEKGNVITSQINQQGFHEMTINYKYEAVDIDILIIISQNGTTVVTAYPVAQKASEPAVATGTAFVSTGFSSAVPVEAANTAAEILQQKNRKAKTISIGKKS
tara:strand:+ start:2209 stop:4374 length:2166 start_codon:yes stop_codon:yes gene_type:complete